MARIRYLKPDFFFDDDLAELKYECRLFFQGLWCYADREGRLEDKPKVLKAQIMPFDNVNVEKLLNLLADKFITRYEVDGRKYIQINNFLKHQKPHHTEKKSTLPECNGNITVKTPLIKRGNGKEKEEDKEKDKGKDVKKKHLDSVLLTDIQLQKLKDKFPQSWENKIENLDRYSRIKPKIFNGYVSHYDVILNWARNEPAETAVRSTHNEKPQKREILKTSPEIDKLHKEMMRLPIDKPEGWQSKVKQYDVKIKNMRKDLNTRPLGNVLTDAQTGR